MKLDKNQNPKGHGKYALVNMRKLIPILDGRAAGESPRTAEEFDIARAFHLLIDYGIITIGSESPGDQFFVMKYKDKFTHHGLRAYAAAVQLEADKAQFKTGAIDQELVEYAQEMRLEAKVAEKEGNRIPD